MKNRSEQIEKYILTTVSKFRRLTVAILVGLLAIALVSCGGANTPPAATAPTAIPASATPTAVRPTSTAVPPTLAASATPTAEVAPAEVIAPPSTDVTNVDERGNTDIDKDAAGAMMFDGGTVQPARLLALYELPPEDLAAGLSTLVSGDLAPICEAECFGDLVRLDVMVDDAFSRALQPARLVAAGAEPVIAYAFAREIEVAALRTVLIGKLSGVSEQTLRSRLRELYG